MVNDGVIALIPARSGSKRIANKNIKYLGNHPLIAYTICSALNSNIFDSVVVSTDSQEIADISKYYGAEIPFLRPAEYATDNSPDFDWLYFTLNKLDELKLNYSYVSILRPTSPFRNESTLKRAWNEFILNKDDIDSLRAVELCGQHPYKMWDYDGKFINPIINQNTKSNKYNQPFHSMQYSSLPEIFVQNASLEIVKKSSVYEYKTISGNTIAPFFTEDFEGIDVNNQIDWIVAETIIQNQLASLPEIKIKPYKIQENIND